MDCVGEMPCIFTARAAGVIVAELHYNLTSTAFPAGKMLALQLLQSFIVKSLS